MGPSILMQWSLPASPTNLADIVLARLLEHYSLSIALRSQTNFRTYRATTSSAFPAPTTRLLTTIQHTVPAPIIRDTQPQPVRDDTTYLFLEDRSAASAASAAQVNGNGVTKVKGEDFETDGFELIDIPDSPATTPAPSKAAPADTPESAKTDMARGSKGVYRMIAVKPSANALTLLQNVLSPFVMGVNKAARAAASTTAQTAQTTPLPGTPFTLITLHFPPLSPPNPPLIITLHTLSSSPTLSGTIFLEAEYPNSPDYSTASAVLREFLVGCLPDPLVGDFTYHEWNEPTGAGGPEGWEGPERTRRMTMLLARCLREASYI